MTSLGFGGPAWTGYTPATRASAAPGAPHTPEPIAEAGVEDAETAEDDSDVPLWIAYCRRHVAALDRIAGYDPISDPGRDDRTRQPLDQLALGLLAELSERMSPWQAAEEAFGSQQNATDGNEGER